jgi:hypothetical protein
MHAEVFALAVGRLGVFSNGRRNRSYEAASMVMVDGCPVAQAVRICGVRRQAVYSAMRRLQAAYRNIGICPSCGRRLESGDGGLNAG